MSYQLFCSDEITPFNKMPDRHRVVTVNSELMGVAIKTACRLVSEGVIVWKILGADGFRMERSDIETEFQRRQRKPPNIPPT
jgi:hypothetical protein